MKRTVFDNIEKEISGVLENANEEVCAMLAWFTNQTLTNALIKLAQNGVAVKIILSNNEWNLLNRPKFDALISLGGQIRSYGSQNPLDGNFLHRKMCIVDRKIVMNGAFNWTKNASRNKEDYSFNDDKTDAHNCIQEFTQLWKQSEKIDWNKIEKSATKTIEELEVLESEGITPDEFQNEVIPTNPINISITSIVEAKEEDNTKLLKSTIELPSTSILNPTENPSDFIYEKDLSLWGIEYGEQDYFLTNLHKKLYLNRHWYKLKFQIENRIINVAVVGKDFIEVLKTNKDYFLYWSKFKKIPIAMLNTNIGSIKLCNPIRFSTLSFSEDTLLMCLHCNYKLITEKDKIVCLNIKRDTWSNLFEYKVSDDEEFIK